MKLKAKVSLTLSEAEDMLRQIADKREAVELWLPRAERKMLFVDIWLVAIMATAARRGGLTVVDWVNEWRDDEPQSRFQSSLEGIAAAKFAADVRHLKGVSGPGGERHLDPSKIRDVVHGAGGRVERGADALSVTLVCLDEADALLPHAPRLLSRLHLDTKAFVHQMDELFVAHLTDGGLQTARPGLDVTQKKGAEISRTLRTKVFQALSELFTNGFEYGARRLSKNVDHGMRFLRLRIVKGTRDAFSRHAAGFHEMTEYFEGFANERHNEYLEITVSDSGPGIVDRYLNERDKFYAEERPDDVGRRRLLQDLLVGGRTESRKPGAGWGIDRALQAVHELKGFVSIRTGEFWLYGSPGASRHSDLADVDYAHPARVRGTHYCILLPLSRGEAI